MEPELFQIGEMARMFHLSVSSIRHYEQIGLLSPEKIDPDTGYRYYGPRQFEVFNTIRYLRALDIPLPQIRNFLQGRDIRQMQQMLLLQKEAIAQKQAELKRIEQKIDARLAQLQAAQTAEPGKIELVSLPVCRLVQISNKLRIREYQDMELPVSRLARVQPEAVVFLGKVGVSVSLSQLEKGDFSEYDGLFLLLDAEESVQGVVTEIPAGTSVRMRFRGSHPQAPEQYQRMMQFMRQHHLAASGFSREITLIDYGLTSDPDRFVTEITIPVKPADPA